MGSENGRSAVTGPVVADGILATLEKAVATWRESGREGRIARWLERELDLDGVPRRLAVAGWAEGLRLLAGAIAARPTTWPERFDARVEGWFRALLRFSRPEGSTVFGSQEPPGDWRRLFGFWADRLSEPGMSTVLDWWFRRPSRDRHAPPPLPADARPDRPLAILRANWLRDGDLLAVDHRLAGTSSLVELFGLGRSWLGPTWDSGETVGRVTQARPVLWVSQSSADVLEWSFRVGPARVVRTAVLLRGRRLALLGEQWNGAGDPGEFRLSMASGIEPKPIPDCRGLSLATVSGRAASARVLPIGLPRLDYPTERGRFGHLDGQLVLRQGPIAGASRVWRPLLVSWDPKRNRQAVHWRALTVAERSRNCPPDVAFAARVTWGGKDTLVVYRSLARPGLRCVLGYQTRARFLIGLFTPEGEVEPLVKIEE